jgi:5,10-methylene-tetrahydrofolate dehydrogenase/methenyl tetrahydrofolate cyclohydrolase
MQREIEALLKAWSQEHRREAQLLQTLLAAISLNAAARQRMLEDIASAAATAIGVATPIGSLPATAMADQLSEAVAKLKAARAENFKKH